MTDELKVNVEGLELYSDQYPFRLPLRIRNFESESEYMKFIRNCELHVRKSIEYRSWRHYIIDVLGVSSCMVTKERMDQCTVEVHHHVPSLFVLVKALVNQKIEREEEFSTFDISLDAIEIHFQNRVGYITLVKSMHEKFHNGFLKIPASLIRGNYQAFMESYIKYLDDEDLDVINSRLAIDEGNCGWSRDNYPALQEVGLS